MPQNFATDIAYVPSRPVASPAIPRGQAELGVRKRLEGRHGCAADECPNVVELSDVSKAYGSAAGAEVTAVANLSFGLASASAVLVEGPSGSGKSTFLGLAGCLIRPSSGRIQVAGSEVTRLPEDRLAGLRRRYFGFVFQDLHLIRGTSALANVMVPALPRAELDGDLRPRALELLARFGLAGRAHERVERLSGGERQRVAIARALINDPAVVLADEPTAHLDSLTAGAFLGLLDELRSEGRAVIVASHDPLLSGSAGFDRRLVLRHGRLLDGSPGGLVAIPFAGEEDVRGGSECS